MAKTRSIDSPWRKVSRKSWAKLGDTVSSRRKHDLFSDFIALSFPLSTCICYFDTPLRECAEDGAA